MMETWISRDKRGPRAFPWLALVLIVLFLVAAGLFTYKYFPGVYQRKTYANLLSNKKPLSSESEIRQFIGSILGDLRLGNTEINLQPLNHDQKRVDYPSYKILWPNKFPYIWFTKRIQSEGRSMKSLSYSAVELNDDNSLLVWLIDTEFADTLAEIELVASAKAAPEMSSIAFLFDNFADFKSQDALNLVWLDIPFGFIVHPDQIPGRKLSKALKSSQGQGILDMPSSSHEWQTILAAQRLAGTISTEKLNEVNVRAIMRLFPALGGFTIPDSAGVDRDLVNLIVNEAEILRLTYVYEPQNLTYADSLVYLKGLRIKSLTGLIDCRGKSEEELKKLLVDRANDFTLADKGILLLDSDTGTVDAIKSLRDLFTRLNIIIVPPLRIAEAVENF
jgi:hypothetical protein